MSTAGPAGVRRGGWMAVGFLVLLLASEAALTLPDEHATSAFVAAFYSGHRAIVIILQVAGFAAAGLLGAYAWRLRPVDRMIAGSGVVLAAVSATPGLITAATALIADPDRPDAAGVLNQLEPRADDALFACVLLFAVSVLLRAGRRHRWLGALAGLTVVACVARFGAEASGLSIGVVASVAPICFLALIGWLAGLSLRGLLTAGSIAPHAG